MADKTRLQALDAIRGLAAFSVVVDHTLVTFPVFYSVLSHATVPTVIALFSYSPLHLFWAGHEAVVLFFVLSGFVLSLPHLNDRASNYPAYVIKRFIRIYIPYAAVVGLSVFVRFLVDPKPLPELSSWFNQMWSQAFTKETGVDLGLMLGRYNHDFVTSSWSLVHEMRISLIFPALAMIIKRTDWKWSVVLAGALTVTNYLGGRLPLAVSPSWLYTVYATSFFIIGATVAKQYDTLVAVVARWNRMKKVGLLTVALFLYLWVWLVPANRLLDNIYVGDAAVTVGTVIVLVLSIGLPGMSTRLGSPRLQWLGRVSYSLYLIHPIVLLLLMHGFRRWLPWSLLAVAVPLVSLLAAEVFYRGVERPSMELGRSLALRFRRIKEKLAVGGD